VSVSAFKAVESIAAPIKRAFFIFICIFDCRRFDCSYINL
jgi:hypothetical protein